MAMEPSFLLGMCQTDAELSGSLPACSNGRVLQREALPYSADRPTCPTRVGEPPRLRMDSDLVKFQHWETRFGLSLPCRYYLPLPGAPAHPCSKWSKYVPSNLTFAEENGNEKALRDSWINAKASYSVDPKNSSLSDEFMPPAAKEDDMGCSQ
ncbi:hypothetical protein B0T13DRAFT_448766 [Neurospora crassa]|nr:hypothetical protein B0T13DRAFT_448766 [Neurospora crassa]